MKPKKIIRAIFNHFRTHKADFKRIYEANYSFEEWSNWEAYFACRQIGIDNIRPRPKYTEYANTTMKGYGDLAINLDSDKIIFIEFGTIYYRPRNNLIKKLEKDRSWLEKLKKRNKNIIPIQILIFNSLKCNIPKDKEWVEMLKTLSFWNKKTIYRNSVNHGKNGSLYIKAWRI